MPTLVVVNDPNDWPLAAEVDIRRGGETVIPAPQ